MDRKEHKSSKDRLVDNLRGHGKRDKSKEPKDRKGHSERPEQAMSVVQQQQPQPSSNQAAYEHPHLSYGGNVEASLRGN